jgi:hypothetical protein
MYQGARDPRVLFEALATVGRWDPAPGLAETACI